MRKKKEKKKKRKSTSRELNAIFFDNVSRIWAPDHVINQLGGPFQKYATLAEVPRGMRAAPDATTWTAAQLYLWWSDPQDDAGKGRVLCPSRQQMVWTVMHVALRLETTSTSPELADVLPPEMWMLIMTFVKHEQPPTISAATAAATAAADAAAAAAAVDADISRARAFATITIAAPLDATTVEIAENGDPGSIVWSDPPIFCKVLRQGETTKRELPTFDIEITASDRADLPVGKVIKKVASWHLR